MKRLTSILMVLGLLLGYAAGQGGLVPTVAPPIPLNSNAVVGPAGTITTPSGFLINVTGGPFYCSGAIGILGATQFALQANTTYTVGVTCQDATPWVRVACIAQGFTGTNPGVTNPCVGNPGLPNEYILATVVTNATVVATITDARAAVNFPLVTDGSYIVPLTDCLISIGATGTLAANVLTGTGNSNSNPGAFRTAAGSVVLQAITTAAANNLNLTCDITPPTKLTAGKGAVINNIQLFYGIQTTAATSISAPTVQSLTYPATGAAAGLTNAAAGGALTVTPGSLQLTTTTSGQCFSENIALGTPIAVTTDLQRVTVDQIFNQTGAASTTLQICGLIVHYTVPMLYSRMERPKPFDFNLLALRRREG